MRELAFRLTNVFAIEGRPFSGNALCVFEDGRGLSSDAMQALALQTNLAETTFLLPAPAPHVDAGVRIFTPTLDMPFAGHPTLGTAFVVRERRGGGDRIVLAMRAGEVEVTAEGDVFTLRAARAAVARAPAATREELAAALGLEAAAIAGDPLWVDTGVEQLVVPLARAEDVRRVAPVPALLDRVAFSTAAGESMAYVVARDGAEAEARFFSCARGVIVEDAATGSACANLGGWLVATGAACPATIEVRQGDLVGRPSRLRLQVGRGGEVRVGGRVTPVGRGALSLAIG
jgi:PhzF family phenazine biosynthesis protein